MPIDPQLAADAAALYGAVKATNEATKLPVVAPVAAAVNAHIQAFAERRLGPALRRVLRLEEAAEVAATETAARLADVAAEDLVDPAPAVAAGVVVALQTRAEEPELRAMFAELLANACRRDRAGGVRLAFVEVLRQLEPEDARLLRVMTLPDDADHFIRSGDSRELPPEGGRVKSFDFGLKGERGYYEYQRPTAVSIDNLTRLGLIVEDPHNGFWLGQRSRPQDGGRVSEVRVALTSFGEAFTRACVRNPAQEESPAPPPLGPERQSSA